MISEAWKINQKSFGRATKAPWFWKGTAKANLMNLRWYIESINQHLGFKWITEFWSSNIIHSSGYLLKALEIANSKIPSLCQPAYWGWAGIGRQLPPLKVEYWKLIKIEFSFSSWWCLGHAFSDVSSHLCQVHLAVHRSISWSDDWLMLSNTTGWTKYFSTKV